MRRVASRRPSRPAALLATAALGIAGLASGSSPAAAAVSTGVIQGIVTGPGGVPVAGASVGGDGGLYGPDGMFQWSYPGTMTGADGRYSITVSPGTYRLEISPPWGSPLAGEYYDDAGVAGKATPVVVAAGATVTVNSQLVTGAVLQGTVRGPGGAPISGVSVAASSGIHAGSAVTDASGHYAIHGLRPGPTVVSFFPLDGSGYVGEFYPDAASFESATPVQLTAGATTAIDAQLATGATLSGHVTTTGGAAFAGAGVSACTDESCGSAVTDAAGAYRVVGLRPGSYRVEFRPPSDSSLGSTYYRDSETFDGAQLVTVAAGGTVTGIDGVVRPGAFVQGRVTAPGGAPVAGVEVETWGESWSFGSTEADGTFRLGPMPAGSYVLQVDGNGALASEFYGDAAAESDATPIVVGRGQTVSGIDVQLNPATSVLATLVNGTGTPVTETGVELVPTTDRSLWAPQFAGHESGADGVSTVDDLRVGAVGRIAVARASADTPYVAQYYVAGGSTTADVDAATVLTVSSTTNISMTLRTGAQISGVVRDASGMPEWGREVVAFVDDESLPSRSAFTAPDGSYTIRGLLPGAYQVAVAPSGTVHDHDWFYLTGSKPPAPNVVVSGTSTTSGIDITAGARFTDVSPSYPFASYITWLASKGISTGYAQPDGTFQFKPTTAVSREAMAAFLFRDIAAPGYTPPGTARFSDVPTSYPFYANVAWLAQQGISTGYADGTFKPTDAVTREAMAAFLYRAAGSPVYTPPATPRFSDVPTSYPFYKQISWLAAQSISTGYADGTFKPTAPVTREAMAAFLQRADPIFHPAQ